MLHGNQAASGIRSTGHQGPTNCEHPDPPGSPWSLWGRLFSEKRNDLLLANILLDDRQRVGISRPPLCALRGRLSRVYQVEGGGPACLRFDRAIPDAKTEAGRQGSKRAVFVAPTESSSSASSSRATAAGSKAGWGTSGWCLSRASSATWTSGFVAASGCASGSSGRRAARGPLL